MFSRGKYHGLYRKSASNHDVFCHQGSLLAGMTLFFAKKSSGVAVFCRSPWVKVRSFLLVSLCFQRFLELERFLPHETSDFDSVAAASSHK
mgnify:CR=1 FL=1|jgi:hypothetical protein